MKKTYKEIQDELIKEYRINVNEHSSCKSRTHIHPKKRMLCKWKQTNSIKSTFTLLHEIGHCENNASWMRRCEEEYYATKWALEKAKELGLIIPDKRIEKYQEYIYKELDRGIRRNGTNYPSKEKMKLSCKPIRKVL